jgi:hypothetical protein
MQMVRYWLAGAAALALMTNFAAAQSSSTDTTIMSRPGYPPAPPTQSYSETKSQRTLDANGVETTKTEHVDKSQTITGGDGSLNAETHVQTSGETTTVAPPVTIYRSQTTTTTDK